MCIATGVVCGPWVVEKHLRVFVVLLRALLFAFICWLYYAGSGLSLVNALCALFCRVLLHVGGRGGVGMEREALKVEQCEIRSSASA